MHKPWVRAQEYIVCAYPDPDHPDAAHFFVRVVRFDNVEGDRVWAVYDTGRYRRLDRAGQWSQPPEDIQECALWAVQRRYTEAEALELARQAAPHMKTGPAHRRMGIDEFRAWNPVKGGGAPV